MGTNATKKHFTYTLKDFYKDYRCESKDSDIEPVCYRTYRGIAEDFLLAIFRKIIVDNYTFMMPYSLGTIMIKSFKAKSKNLRINWNLTRKFGKVIKHVNRHTFGYAFGVVWDKSYVRFKNNAYYLFTATSSKCATKLGIGKKGLSQHINALSKDPTKRSYIRM